jgi:hypothetical protein
MQASMYSMFFEEEMMDVKVEEEDLPDEGKVRSR